MHGETLKYYALVEELKHNFDSRRRAKFVLGQRHKMLKISLPLP